MAAPSQNLQAKKKNWYNASLTVPSPSGPHDASHHHVQQPLQLQVSDRKCSQSISCTHTEFQSTFKRDTGHPNAISSFPAAVCLHGQSVRTYRSKGGEGRGEGSARATPGRGFRRLVRTSSFSREGSRRAGGRRGDAEGRVVRYSKGNHRVSKARARLDNFTDLAFVAVPLLEGHQGDVCPGGSSPRSPHHRHGRCATVSSHVPFNRLSSVGHQSRREHGRGVSGVRANGGDPTAYR